MPAMRRMLQQYITNRPTIVATNLESQADGQAKTVERSVANTTLASQPDVTTTSRELSSAQMILVIGPQPEAMRSTFCPIRLRSQVADAADNSR